MGANQARSASEPSLQSSPANSLLTNEHNSSAHSSSRSQSSPDVFLSFASPETDLEPHLGIISNSHLSNIPSQRSLNFRSVCSSGIGFEVHSSPFICLICQSELNEINKVQVPVCLHNFCQDCIRTYLEIRITESQVDSMPCPEHSCGADIQEEFISMLIPEELFFKFKKFQKAQSLNKNPNLRWCPKPDCEGWDKGNMQSRELTCNQCGFKFCYYCQEPWHGNSKCRAQVDFALDKYSKKNNVKQCPQCRRRVEKNQGCDHMTCPACRYEWCWLCGEPYMVGHFENCEGKKILRKYPPLWVVLGLTFSPLLLPFGVVILACFWIENMINEWHLPGSPFHRFLTSKWLSYPCAILVGLLLTPIVFALAPFVLGVMATREILDQFQTCGELFGVVVLGILLSPLVVVSAVVFLLVAQLMGVGYLVLRVYVHLRRCWDPNYMVPPSYVRF